MQDITPRHQKKGHVSRQRRQDRAGLEELIEVMNRVQVVQVIHKEKDAESFHDVRPHRSRRPHRSTHKPGRRFATWASGNA
jgi:hypothetical protein